MPRSPKRSAVITGIRNHVLRCGGRLRVIDTITEGLSKTIQVSLRLSSTSPSDPLPPSANAMT